MSKIREGIQRLLVIINKLKGPQKIVSRDDLLEYVENRMTERDSKGIDLRTLQRDFHDISDLFGITVRYDNYQKGYYIEEDEWKDEQCNQLLLNFELLNALDSDSNLPAYILSEHHRPANSEYMSQLIKAIKARHPISIQYEYIREDGVVRQHRLLPHYLKEDQHRWYLLAVNEKGELRTFSVDGIRELQISYDETFQRSTNIHVEELFKFSYGIWNQESIPVEEIELSYSPLDGKFLKRLPLHHSQEILVDNQKEFRIRVKLRITNDFVMALLSRSKSLTVLKPLHLRNQIREIYENALLRNQN